MICFCHLNPCCQRMKKILDLLLFFKPFNNLFCFSSLLIFVLFLKSFNNLFCFSSLLIFVLLFKPFRNLSLFFKLFLSFFPYLGKNILSFCVNPYNKRSEFFHSEHPDSFRHSEIKPVDSFYFLD